MAYKAVPLTDALSNYVNEQITHETAHQKALRAVTRKLPNAQMQIAPDQAAFLTLMIKLTNAKKALEIGTFTGYSALTVATALPADGHLTCCDVSKEWTDIAQQHWQEAGIQNKITLILAPAAQTLQKLIDDDAAGTFDFALIDADKTAYDTYYELVLQLLRPGGLLVLDNMLRGGKVADPNHHDESTDAIRALNQKIASDPRVTPALLTIADGFMCACKQPRKTEPVA